METCLLLGEVCKKSYRAPSGYILDGVVGVPGSNY